MQEATIRKKIIALNDFITVSHIGQVAKTGGSEGAYLPARPDERASVEDVLELLALHTKYLLFDLEATRRENRYLRQLLEARPSRPDDESDDKPSL